MLRRVDPLAASAISIDVTVTTWLRRLPLQPWLPRPQSLAPLGCWSRRHRRYGGDAAAMRKCQPWAPPWPPVGVEEVASSPLPRSSPLPPVCAGGWGYVWGHGFSVSYLVSSSAGVRWRLGLRRQSRSLRFLVRLPLRQCASAFGVTSGVAVRRGATPDGGGARNLPRPPSCHPRHPEQTALTLR